MCIEITQHVYVLKQIQTDSKDYRIVITPLEAMCEAMCERCEGLGCY